MRALPLLLLLAACKGSTDDTAAPVTELSLLGIPVSAFELGLMDEDDSVSYDPRWSGEYSIGWRPAQGAEAQADGSILLRHGQHIHSTISISDSAEGRQLLLWRPADGSPDIGFYRITLPADADEAFYGLGEVFDTPNHRGQTRDMQLEAEGTTESGYNEAHVPIPLVIGTTGWGAFIQDDHPMRFEVATESDDTVRVTIGTGVQSALGLTLHVMEADHPLDITKHYYDVTGYPKLPAPWGLGPVMWRDENVDQAEVIRDITSMRDLDLPASGIWIDRPYASGVNSFDWHPDQWTDPQAMIDEAHDKGFRVALWHTPYADEETAPIIHAEAMAGGYFPPTRPPAFIDWGNPIDFTNPEAYAWWQGHVRAYTDMGIEGFKLDFAEEVILALPGRLPWEFHDGSDERTMHRNYTRLYHQVYAETLPEEYFLICRAGSWGDQTVTSVIWPGDIDGNLAEHGEDMGEFVAVGGLPAAVVAHQSLGPSGYPFFGSDTGGYRHTPPDKETFTRWFQHTAASTVMQIGMSSSNVAWEPVLDWDAEMLDWYREYTRLHLQLYPYLWTEALDIAQDGHPIVRPLGLAHPELGQHPKYDYLLGEQLLVAPVVKHGDRTRDITFPEGTWVDWFDGSVHSAGAATVDAPLSKLPLYLKAGGIVPLLRPTIDTLAPTTTPDDIDSFATDAGVLTVRVFGGPASEYVVYDGATIGQEETGTGLELTWADGSVFDQGAVFEVLGSGEPSSVTLDGATLEGWSYADGVLSVPVPGGSHTVVVEAN